MSIKAYVGRMGSGKTYEVVSEIIVKALSRGRRVVSNIAGLDIEAIKGLLVDSGIPEAQIGELVQIDHEQVLSPYFWRSDQPIEAKAAEPVKTSMWGKARQRVTHELTPAGQGAAVPADYFIQPGDLVALDEIWRFWGGFAAKDGDGNKRPASVMNFFRMHRHFTHPQTGVSCDVALITQDVMDLSRNVRAVIEETYYMEKLTAIGSTKRYRVDIFQGGKTSGKPLRQLQRSYDPKVFPLYSSHSQKKAGDADAVEENIDQRGNILKGALFKVVLPVGLIVACFAVYTVWSFFNPKAKGDKANTAQAKPGAAQPTNVSHAKPGPDIAEDWRVVGYYQIGADVVMVLNNGQRNRTLHGAPGKVAGLSMEVILPNGEAATDWTGGKSGGMLPGGAK